MNFMKRILLAGTIAVCALTMSVTSLAADTSDLYYCNGYAHTNGRCTGHSGHHTSAVTGTTRSATTITPAAPTTPAPVYRSENTSSYSGGYYYGGHHSGGHHYGGYHH